MAEFDATTRCTTLGKVVYRRKKHFFTSRDVERIAVKTSKDWISEENQEGVISSLNNVRDLIDQWLQEYYPVDDDTQDEVEFGGGESGGAGAGGEF